MIERPRVAIIGGGIVGLACADDLVQAGCEVLVFDPAPASGATYAAAGMLAPGGEAWYGEHALLQLGADSLARWPGYAADLERRSGCHVDLRSGGTLLVAADRDDLAEVQRKVSLLAAHDVEVEQLDRRALRRQEPTLSTQMVGGALLPEDQHVNPRRVTDALLAVLGNRVVRVSARAVADGVELPDGGTVVADVVILASGALGIPHVRPVRGEAVRVRLDDGPSKMLRGRLYGENVYLVPRSNGELVIGATEDEHPASATAPLPTVGGVGRLLEAARALVPGVDTAQILEVVARDRPGSPDNGPMLGEIWSTGPARLLVAGGHHRGGVLLAPVTAATMRACVTGADVPPVALPFKADRFQSRSGLATPPTDETRTYATER